MPHVNELHEQHDQILVVALASGDFASADPDRTNAQALVDSCADCARLHDDVLTIARATKALPPAVRTRDFRLSPEQAATLRPSAWRRLVAGLAAPGSVFSRPLGLGLATLGIAGLLLGTLPSVSLGLGGAASATAAPMPEAASSPGASAAAALPLESAGDQTELAPVAGGPPAAASAAPGIIDTAGGANAAASPPAYIVSGSSGKPITISGDGGTRYSADASPPAADNAGPKASDPTRQIALAAPPDSSSGGPSALVVASTILLAAGIVVLLLRSIARRLTAV
jgi:hypothetical protein